MKSDEGVTHYKYDSGGTMIVITKPDGTVCERNTYNSKGLLASSYLYGKTTNYTYVTDKQDRIVASETTNSDGTIDDYTYDSNGNATRHLRRAAGAPVKGKGKS